MNFFSSNKSPPSTNSPAPNTTANPEPVAPAEPTNKDTIYPSLPLQADLEKDCEFPSMEHSTTSSRANTGGSWFSSTASSNPNSGILPQFIGFAGANPNDVNGDESPDQQRVARRMLDLFRQRLRPWTSEFFSFAKFGWPPSVVKVVPRIKHNLQYFTTNYLCLAAILLIYCILTSFLMLLTLVVLGGLIYTIYTRTQKGPVVISGYEIPPSLLYTLALMVCFPMFVLADVGEVMYWVIGSSFFLILAHSTFYCSEEVPGSEFEVVNVVSA